MIIKLLIFTLFYFFINNLFLKKNVFLDKTETSKHKSKVSTQDKTPLTGGLIIVLFLFFTPIIKDIYFLLAILLIYLVGILSDLNILASPLKRIFFQLFIFFVYIILGDLEIRSISIDFFDKLLEINLFNVFFILLCLLVLINGSNFIDGLNTLVVNYFLICLISIYYSSVYYSLQLDFDLFRNLTFILMIISAFNFFGKSFLGDSGTYSLSFLVGVLCINFIYYNSNIVSPYFIAVLLWYPAIENLFSIIRRSFSKRDLSGADNMHLHHLIYLFFKRKNFIENKILVNSFSGILINLYNFLIIFLSLFYISNSKMLVTIILFNIVIYLLAYKLFRDLNTD